MLQKGLGRSAEQNRGLRGAIRLKSGPHLVLFVLLHGGRPGSGRPRTFLENILPQERYQLVSDLKAAVNTVGILSKSCMFFWVFRFAKNTNFLPKGGIRFFL